MQNLLTRNYIFLFMVFLTVLMTYINKHGTVLFYFPCVILSLIYMIIHRAKFVINRGVAIFLLIFLWSLISSSWAVNPFQGVKISFILLLIIVAFQVLHWLSTYTPKNEINPKERKNKISITTGLCRFLDKYGSKGIDYIAYAIILTSIVIIIDSMLSGKISVLFFHKQTLYKNQFWYEGNQTLIPGLLGGISIILYKRKKFKLLFAIIFISLASIITNFFYTGYAGIIFAFLTVIVIAIFPRKISLWIMIISLTLYYFLFPTIFGLLYDSHFMAKVEAFSPPSLIDRYIIWEYAHLLINKAWLFGHGAHSSRYINQAMRSDLIRTTVLPGVMKVFTHHPHNLASQIWVEYGLFGVLAYCLFLVTILKKIFSEKIPKYATIFLMISFMMITAIQNTAWGMWETWFMVSITISLGLGNFIITYLEHQESKG